MLHTGAMCALDGEVVGALCCSEAVLWLAAEWERFVERWEP